MLIEKYLDNIKLIRTIYVVFSYLNDNKYSIAIPLTVERLRPECMCDYIYYINNKGFIKTYNYEFYSKRKIMQIMHDHNRKNGTYLFRVPEKVKKEYFNINLRSDIFIAINKENLWIYKIVIFINIKINIIM